MHLSAALFAQMADMKLVEVPYRGSGPAALDVLAGQVPLAVVDLPSALQHIKAGKLTAYAVTSPQRLPMLPDVPTVSEAGPGRLRLHRLVWRGGARRHARAVVARLNAEITAALNDDAIKTSHAQPGRGASAGHGAGV
jgi:tripartite-type tricarboxylate transporter receptor subunit TctC